jgi:hypothetical protein
MQTSPEVYWAGKKATQQIEEMLQKTIAESAPG